uniref:Claudin 8.2 n=1 Tax=Salmo trutta TaxID=8032 RepID=A0A673WNP2_SALTR
MATAYSVYGKPPQSYVDLACDEKAAKVVHGLEVVALVFGFIRPDRGPAHVEGDSSTKVVDHRTRTKHIVLVTGGCLLLVDCVTIIIPVSWTTHVVIRDLYNLLLIVAQRRELGEELYIEWVTSALLFVAGVNTAVSPRTLGRRQVDVKDGLQPQRAWVRLPAWSEQAAGTTDLGPAYRPLSYQPYQLNTGLWSTLLTMRNPARNNNHV